MNDFYRWLNAPVQSDDRYNAGSQGGKSPFELTPSQILDDMAAEYGKKYRKTRKQREAELWEFTGANLSTRRGGPSLIIVILLSVTTLLLVWIGIGVLMNRGVLPAHDLGYEWLRGLLQPRP